MNAESGDNVAAATGEGRGLAAVGQRLASARREQQHTVAAVASGLHLKPDIVEALEAGDESALPAMTFVRGYIKAYARFLGLDEQDVLAALPADTGYRARPLKGVSVGPKPSLDLPVGKWLVWLMVLAVVVVLVMYGMPLVERLMDRTGQPAADTSSLNLPLGESGPADAPTGLPAFNSEPDAADTTQEYPLTESAPDMSTSAQTTEPAALAPVAVPPVEQAPAQPAVEPVAAGPAKVTLRFAEDSWVEMESHGRKLVVGTQRAGSERTVQAEPPIQILLGNAPGVTVIYRGETVDLEPYQRGKVARLVLED